jgi:hypothetical protein
MIYEWRHYLVAHGFKKFYTTLFVRASRPIAAMISQTALRDGSKQVRVDLGLTIHDPFGDEDAEIGRVHLRGEVGTDGIRVHNMRSENYVSSTPWHATGQKDAVFALLERCMEPWFEYWTRPKRLIEHFLRPPDVVITRPAGSGVEHVADKHPFWWDQPPLVALLRSEISVAKGGPPGELSPADWLKLSLLYYHLGNRLEALRYAKLYLGFAREGIPVMGEPERTLRQIKGLSNL